jgi:hypothetical protein
MRRHQFREAGFRARSTKKGLSGHVSRETFLLTIIDYLGRISQDLVNIRLKIALCERVFEVYAGALWGSWVDAALTCQGFVNLTCQWDFGKIYVRFFCKRSRMKGVKRLTLPVNKAFSGFFLLDKKVRFCKAFL